MATEEPTRISTTTPPEGGPDRTVDIPDSWWRQHLHVAVWLLVVGLFILFLRYAAEALVPLVLSAL